LRLQHILALIGLPNFHGRMIILQFPPESVVKKAACLLDMANMSLFVSDGFSFVGGQNTLSSFENTVLAAVVLAGIPDDASEPISFKPFSFSTMQS
jgi:hypothetical protein